MLSANHHSSSLIMTAVKVVIFLALALMVTLAIFSFMQYLINPSQTDVDMEEISGVVELYRPPPQQDEPEPEPEPEQETLEEPSMDAISTDVAETSQTIEQTMPDVDMGSMAMNFGSAGKKWSAPASAGDLSELLDDGKEAKGYLDVVPRSTVQPNIPELAWKNKLNGWVLVVFNIAVNGNVTNARILDSNPKGIFEEEVIRALKGWRYSVGHLKNYQGDMVVTQKIELFWKDYPGNVPYFD